MTTIPRRAIIHIGGKRREQIPQRLLETKESILFDKRGGEWIGTDEGLNLITHSDNESFYSNISNKKGLLIKINNKGRIIVPRTSICLNGFKVTRPSFFAVSSPKRFAGYP